MKLRLYHHTDGARIAYREAGTGPPLVLLHSAGLSHREWSPLVAELADRFRLVLPDLPLHGDSEDRPRHPYTRPWLLDVLSGFARDAGGPRPIIGGHDLGALLALEMVAQGRLRPSHLVLMPCSLHRRSPREQTLLRAGRAGAIPGVGRLLTHAAPHVWRPGRDMAATQSGHAAARDLLRHATADLPGNVNRARAWARLARHWERPDVMDVYRDVRCPTLLLWADRDAQHPEALAEEALDLLPDAQLRVLSSTGFLIAYDDAVGVGREIAAFCG